MSIASSTSSSGEFILELDSHQFNKDVKKILKKFGKDAPQVVSTELQKIGKDQVNNMKNRLKKKGGFARAVANAVDLKITGHSKDNIAIVNIGAEPTFGTDRAENLNFSEILALGHPTPAAVGKGKQEKYMSDGKTGQAKGMIRGFFKGGYWRGNLSRTGRLGTGKTFKVGKVYGKRREPEQEMFPKAIKLTKKAIETDLGPALEKQWVKYNKLFKERR